MAALDFILCLSPWQRQRLLGSTVGGQAGTPHWEALGRGGSKGNHPGLNRNSIGQARHTAAPDGECALEEPLLVPMGSGLVSDILGALQVLVCLLPQFKK